MEETEKRFEKLLFATNDADLINAYADLKEKINHVIEMADKALNKIYSRAENSNP